MIETLADLGPYGIAVAFGFSLGILVALALLAKRWPNGKDKP